MWQVLLIASATALVIVFAIGLRLYQPSAPDLQPESEETTDGTASQSRSSETQNSPVIEFSPEQIAWREQALEALEGLMARLQPLEKKGVQVWATEEYRRLVQTIEEAEQLYDEQQFRQARDVYKDAHLLVGALERAITPTFAKYTEQATRFISEKQYDQALNALEVAQLIEPENMNIPVWVNTARNGDAIDRLTIKASFALGENQPTDALSLLHEAISLDQTREDVRRLIADAETQSRQMAFRQYMKNGHAALESQEFSGAIDLFKQAMAIEPDSREASGALELAEKQKLAHDLHQLEERAATAMANEKWQQAIQHFRDALNLQLDTAFAQEGLDRATFFSEKTMQMDDLLRKPERLADDSVASFASSLLMEVEATELPPRFAETASKLQQMLLAYSSSVQVTLVSDNRSEITLLRRESFSPFREKTLQLKPGQYTLVARRDGYRDKRITFTVPLDASDFSVTIGVDEKL